MRPQSSPLTAPAGSSRMTLANVVRGKQERPLRALVYGVEGVGKSSFGAAAPAPIFLCAEDGTSHLDVARFPSPKSWADVREAVRVLTREQHSFKTLVIDTLDWLEPLCWAHVCQVGGKQSVEDFGYGKGYTMAVEEWRKLVADLDHLVRLRKMHVVMLAHAHIKRVDDPQAGAFDRYQLKVNDKASSVLREWVDAVLFARHEVVTIERNGKLRGRSSGARLLHTTWTAAYDAKNRFDLPETLSLDWDEFELACRAHTPADPARLQAEILELLPRFPADEQAKLDKALREWAGDNSAKLAQLLDKCRGKLVQIEASEASS
jgi:hypothetical protein